MTERSTVDRWAGRYTAVVAIGGWLAFGYLLEDWDNEEAAFWAHAFWLSLLVIGIMAWLWRQALEEVAQLRSRSR